MDIDIGQINSIIFGMWIGLICLSAIILQLFVLKKKEDSRRLTSRRESEND